MVVADLITLAKSKTGRLDLADAEWLRLMNDACLLLDQLEDSDLRTERFFVSITTGNYIAALPSAIRTVAGITVHTADAAVVRNKADVVSLRAALRDDPDGTLEPGVWAVVTGGISTDYTINQLPIYTDTVAIQTTITDRLGYLITYPKMTEDCVIEIDAIAGSATLDATVQTTNYWTLHYASYVVEALSYLLMKDLINIDQSTRILQDLQSRVRPISYDLYNEGINQMGG